MRSMRKAVWAAILVLGVLATAAYAQDAQKFFGSMEYYGRFFLGKSVNIIMDGSTADTNYTTITVTDPTAARTWTVPDSSDTFVGLAATQTLTNKTTTGTIYSGAKWRGTVTTYTGATDAIDISLGDVFILNRSGAVDASTLADPAAGDEGRTVIVQNGTTQANTITITSGLGGSGGSYDLLTFTNVVAANCVFRAYGTKWYLVGGYLCAVS